MTKVSIIVPIYNVEKYLDRCMQSLLNQTLKDIEIIMVDDGSPDNCPKMCDEYAKKDGRIKVIHKQNGGLGYARNSGLDIATGEYVAFVDSDDFVDNKMFETMYKKADKEKSDVVYCNHYIYYSNTGKVTEPSRPFIKDVTFRGSDVVNEVLKNMIASSPEEQSDRKYYMSVWRGIFKRNIVHDIRFVSEKEFLSEDILYQVNVLRRVSSVTITNERLYYYRENENSLTHKYRKDRIPKSITLYEHLKGMLVNVNIDNKEVWDERLMKFLYGYFKFSMYSNIKAVSTSDKKQLRKDFELCCNYFNDISFYSTYPINRIPIKQRLILFLFRHKMFYMFYVLIKMTK